MPALGWKFDTHGFQIREMGFSLSDQLLAVQPFEMLPAAFNGCGPKNVLHNRVSRSKRRTVNERFAFFTAHGSELLKSF
jgi:hypothetical protein